MYKRPTICCHPQLVLEHFVCGTRKTVTELLDSMGLISDSYACDTQLYLSIKPDETNPLNRVKPWLEDIQIRMTHNFLLLNVYKTEEIAFGPDSLKNKLSQDLIWVILNQFQMIK